MSTDIERSPLNVNMLIRLQTTKFISMVFSVELNHFIVIYHSWIRQKHRQIRSQICRRTNFPVSHRIRKRIEIEIYRTTDPSLLKQRLFTRPHQID